MQLAMTLQSASGSGSESVVAEEKPALIVCAPLSKMRVRDARRPLDEFFALDELFRAMDLLEVVQL